MKRLLLLAVLAVLLVAGWWRLHGLSSWSLDGDELLPGSTRGLSNEFVGSTASVRVGDGVVLVVRPGVEA